MRSTQKHGPPLSEFVRRIQLKYIHFCPRCRKPHYNRIFRCFLICLNLRASVANFMFASDVWVYRMMALLIRPLYGYTLCATKSRKERTTQQKNHRLRTSRSRNWWRVRQRLNRFYWYQVFTLGSIFCKNTKKKKKKKKKKVVRLILRFSSPSSDSCSAHIEVL